MRKLLGRLVGDVVNHWKAECKDEKRFHVHYNFWKGKGWECAGEWDNAEDAERMKRYWEKRAEAAVLDTGAR